MRLYVAMKMMDKKGQGSFTEHQLKQFFCANGEHHLFSAKRLKGILYAGNDLFWKYWPEKNTVWLFSPKRVAENLECESVGSHQVIIPHDAVFASIKIFKAFCYQAFLVTTKETPISRNKLESVIGVSDDTMRQYEVVSFDNKTNVRTKSNYILLCRGYDSHSAQYQELTWQYGQCVRIVHNGKVYTATRTANSYLSPIELVNSGKTTRKQINKHLANIWRKTGNAVNKVFYQYVTKGCERGNYLLVTSKFGGNIRKPARLGVSNLWCIA